MGQVDIPEKHQGRPPSPAKTGGMNTEWVEFDSPKPPAVDDHYAFWSDAPPELSERCRWWLHQIERGWRPNKYVRREGYDSSAQWYGVWIYEYLHVIAPALRAAESASDGAS